MEELEFGLWGKILLGSMLFFIMFAVGTSLEFRSFQKSLQHPRAFLVGIFCQYALMPLIALCLATAFSLSPEVFLILLIIGCCPGGTSSNMFTFLVKGDVSLSVALTMTSSLLAVVTTPLLIGVYAGHSGAINLVIPFKNIVMTLIAALFPVLLGMGLRIFKNSWASYAEMIAHRIGLGIVFVMILIWIPKLWNFISFNVGAVFLAVALMSLLGMLIGIFLSRFVGISHPSSMAVGFETGIQNAPLAYAIVGLSFASDHPVQSVSWVALVYGALSVGNAIFVMLAQMMYATGLKRKSKVI